MSTENEKKKFAIRRDFWVPCRVRLPQVLWLFGLRETSPGQVREQQDTDNGVEDDPQETEGGGPGEAVEGVVRQEGRGGGGVMHCLQEHPAADLLQRRCKQKRTSTSRVNRGGPHRSPESHCTPVYYLHQNANVAKL